MLIAMLVIKAKKWKEPNCQDTDGSIKKAWHMGAVEHYSAMKRVKSFICDNIVRQGGPYVK